VGRKQPLKSLTDSQKTFVDSPGSNYVRACPGSGKTRAIVARYLRRAAEEKRKGVALLSFTNVAVDEVGRRCGQNPELLRHPHFIGTFDGFIQRLIIGPRFASRNLLQPRFIESWDVQDVTKITPDPKRPYEFLSLEWFDFGEDNEPTLMQDRISGPFRVSRLKLYEAHEATCKRLAKEKRIARLKKGYIACSEARRQLLFRLRDPGRRDSTVELLAARFAEVIVDEAQDCGIEELELLKALVEQRVHVCLVGDPDQAIFEFRNAVPEKVHEFGRALGAEHVFDENFRSSPAICATNSSFRCFEGSDEAAGPNSDCDWPVYLLPFDALPKVGSGFSALVNKHGVDRRGAIVVSHATKHAAVLIRCLVIGSRSSLLELP
jgi:DNA helicase II / ATP-dependent DNA helicase PcrA